MTKSTKWPNDQSVWMWQTDKNTSTFLKWPNYLKSNYFEKCSILAKNTKWLNEYIRFLNDQKQITYHFYNEWPKTLNDPMTTLIPFKLCFLSYPKEWLKTPNDSIITYSFLIYYKIINYLWNYKITKWPINRRSFFLIFKTDDQEIQRT